jgi:hypothetical protein
MLPGPKWGYSINPSVVIQMLGHNLRGISRTPQYPKRLPQVIVIIGDNGSDQLIIFLISGG